MSRAITIRTDEALYERLDAVARATDRSRNFLANQVLKEFLERQGKAGPVPATIPVAERIEDYRSQFWQEDDTEAFLVYLEEERVQSLEDDRMHPKSQSLVKA